MLSPHSFDHLVTARYAELLREASAERLASQIIRCPTRWRSRLAEALYSLAVRLDPCVSEPLAEIDHAFALFEA